jgi:uncharacterized protein YukE
MYHEGLVDQARGFTAWAAMSDSCATWLRNHPIDNIAEHPAYSRAATASTTLRMGLTDWFDKLNAALCGVASELQDVARESEENDLAEQAKIDATDPQTYAGYYEHADGIVEIAPDYEVIDSLLFPVFEPPNGGAGFYCDLGSYDHLNDREVDLIPDDLLSPAGWLQTILGWVGATDINYKVLQAFGGRWGDLVEFTETLGGMISMLEEMAGALKSSVGALDTYWQGHAANSAQAYFSDLLKAIGDTAQNLKSAQNALKQYSAGIEQLAALLTGQLEGLYNTAIFACIAAIVGTATIETGVGPLAGYGLSGVALLRLFFQVKEIRDTILSIQDLYVVLDTIDKLSTSMAAVTSSIRIPEMVRST